MTHLSRAFRLSLSALLAGGVSLLAGAASAQVVEITQGAVRGVVDGGAEVFKGIPFAAAPVGELRWRPPAAPPTWSGVRQANAFSPACPQSKPRYGAVAAAVPPDPPFTTSEDCLYLNVWRPASASPASRLPVMMWIYGGAFRGGRGSMPSYSGAELTKHGVILVTINYRLGPLGFLAAPQLTAEDPHHSSGEYGILDQIAALQWIRRNISAFGGDPDRVTIFGESAGGAEVGMLAASPLASGLFQRAISESGSFFGPPIREGEQGAGDLLLSTAEVSGAAFLKGLGASTAAEARKLSADELIAANEPGPGHRPVFFRPVIDGWFLPKPQYDLYEEGRYNRVPVLVGTNSDEGALFVQSGPPAAQYVAMMKTRFGPYAAAMLKAFPGENDAQALRSSRDLQRDGLFGWAAWTWARLQTAKGGPPVYVYNFDHRPPYPDEPVFKGAGAGHGAEIPYVFGTLLPGQLPWTADDRAISADMVRYWTDFAKSGDPNGPGVSQWAAWTPTGEQSMHFNQAGAGMGRVENLNNLRAFDSYYSWRRDQLDK